MPTLAHRRLVLPIFMEPYPCPQTTRSQNCHEKYRAVSPVATQRLLHNSCSTSRRRSQHPFLGRRTNAPPTRATYPLDNPSRNFVMGPYHSPYSCPESRGTQPDRVMGRQRLKPHSSSNFSKHHPSLEETNVYSHFLLATQRLLRTYSSISFRSERWQSFITQFLGNIEIFP